jgi:hypothetical protein
MFSYCTPITSLDIEITGTERKRDIRVCEVNACINYPSWRTINGEILTVQVGIHGN